LPLDRAPASFFRAPVYVFPLDRAPASFLLFPVRALPLDCLPAFLFCLSACVLPLERPPASQHLSWKQARHSCERAVDVLCFSQRVHRDSMNNEARRPSVMRLIPGSKSAGQGQEKVKRQHDVRVRDSTMVR